MKEAFVPFEPLHKKGIAVGSSNIRTDSIDFTFRKEKFSFNCEKVLPDIAKYNGYFYVAKVSDLRKLKREAKRG